MYLRTSRSKLRVFEKSCEFKVEINIKDKFSKVRNAELVSGHFKNHKYRSKVKILHL